MATGESGYLAAADAIMTTATTIKEGIRAMPELEVIGDPTFLIAFKSAGDLDIYLVNDALIARGWRMIALQYPAALHFCVTRPNTAPGLAEAFLEALRAAVAYAREHKGKRPRVRRRVRLRRHVAGQRRWSSSPWCRVLDAFHETAPEAPADAPAS